MCAALPSSSPSNRAKSIECCGPSRSTGDDDEGDGGEEEETEVAAALLYEGGIAVVPEERRPQHMETEGPGRILESGWGHMRTQINEMTIAGLDMTGEPFFGRVAVALPTIAHVGRPRASHLPGPLADICRIPLPPRRINFRCLYPGTKGSFGLREGRGSPRPGC